MFFCFFCEKSGVAVRSEIGQVDFCSFFAIFVIFLDFFGFCLILPWQKTRFFGFFTDWAFLAVFKNTKNTVFGKIWPDLDRFDNIFGPLSSVLVKSGVWRTHFGFHPQKGCPKVVQKWPKMGVSGPWRMPNLVHFHVKIGHFWSLFGHFLDHFWSIFGKYAREKRGSGGQPPAQTHSILDQIGPELTISQK